MPQSIIVVGDKTSHGGRVITGSPSDRIDGQPIARKGDLVDCPMRYPDGRLHGVNPIIEGDDSHMLDGRPIALHGHRSECGCTLIGSTGSFVGG
ncbi:PAAR domain-containing protein [Cupriavidus sp. 2MCAB6]|uniref:PAAR domain-containing protein n=1 Tax=Cupriavidus sp. 2MCAB6 TaxID=3232981 RepID=UPI003F8F6E8A